MAFRVDLEAVVLGVLASGPAHGYEVAQRIRRLSGDILRVGEGQLYPALHQLESDGCVVAEWVPQEGKPARKVYVLTEKGRKVLARQQESWSAFAGGVNAVMQGGSHA